MHIISETIRDENNQIIKPMCGRCNCGRIVELWDFTNTCECGRDYNFAGQELAPRECWGEETGEHWTECY